ncbi:MAG: DUF4430 domain-containing protein [Methanosarcina mazei]
MKMKLMVFLLVLCLALPIVAVQAQTDVFGNMENINMITTGDITETITCDIIGNAVIVEEMEFEDNMSDDNMSNVTDGMNNATGNTTDVSSDMNIPETLEVSGKIILIKDMGNMTEKAVMAGKVDGIPGSVVIFGKTDGMAEGMDDATENMTEAGNNVTETANNVTETADNANNATNNATNDTSNMDVSRNITIITTGNMTGTIMLNTSQGMDNASGMNNMTEGMDNMTVLTAGNMTGTVTGDMTRKMVVIKNIADAAEISEAIANLTETDTGTANMTEPAAYNFTGNMVIVRSTDDVPEIDEEDIDDLIAMDGNTAIIGAMDNTTEMEENTNQGVENVTKKMVAVRNIDDMVRIVTWTVICNITQNTATIEDIGDLVEKMTNVTTGNVTNVTDNVTGNMTNVTTDNMTGVADNVTDNMTGNMTGVTTGNMTNVTGDQTGNVSNVPLKLESIQEIENDREFNKMWFVYINGEPAQQDFGMNKVNEGDVISFWYTTEDDGNAVLGDALYVANITVVDEAEEQENENEDLTVLFDNTVNLTEGTFTFTPEGSNQESEIDNFTDIGALNASGLEFVASVMDNATDDTSDDMDDMNNDDMGEDDTNNMDTGTEGMNENDTDDMNGDDSTNNDM